MARRRASPSSYTSTRSRLAAAAWAYLKALFEAMKTKPKAVERTMTYYPEAVELTEVDVERVQLERKQAEADAVR